MWRAVLGNPEDQGEAAQRSLSLLHRADPDGYQLLVDGDRMHIDVPGSDNGSRYVPEGPERASA